VPIHGSSLQRCTLSEEPGACTGFPVPRSPHLCYLTPPRQDFHPPLDIPFPSGSGYAWASTPASAHHHMQLELPLLIHRFPKPVAVLAAP